MAPTPEQTEKETKRTVRVFAVASFLNDMGSDIIAPLWPIFVRDVLKANMSVLGFVDGFGDAVVSLSQAFSGYLSDRLRKRKVFVWTGYVFGALSRFGYALSPSWHWLVPFKLIDRTGKMRGAPRDAIIADISTDANRGRHFGILRMMDNLGAFVGIVIAVAITWMLGTSEHVLRTLFLFTAIPTLAGAILVLVAVKEAGQAKTLFKGFSLRHLNRNVALALGFSAVFSLGSFGVALLQTFAQQAGCPKIYLPVLYLVFTAVATATSIPFGKLADRIGRKMVLLASFILWALVTLVFVGVAKAGLHFAALGLPFVLLGLHKGAWEPVKTAFIAELAPSEVRASTLGAFQMVMGLCALPASFGAGWLADHYGIVMPLALSCAITVTAIALLLLVHERRPA